LDGEKEKNSLSSVKFSLGKFSKGYLQIQVSGYFQVTEHEDLLADSLFLWTI